MINEEVVKAALGVMNAGKPKLVNGVLFATSAHAKSGGPLNESRDHERILKKYTFNSKSLNKNLFNKFMAGQHPDEEEASFKVKDIDDAVASYGDPNHGKLHMGIAFDPSDYLKNGTGHIHFPAFSSTSVSPRVAQNFSKGHVLDIDMKGHESASIDHLSYYGLGAYNDPEYEHVLPRHTTVKLSGESHIDQETGAKHWKAEVVGQGSIPKEAEALRQHPVNLGAYEHASPEDLHKAIIKDPSEKNTSVIASHPNLSKESVNLLSSHPSREVRSALSEVHDLPEEVRAKMVEDDVPKVHEHLNRWGKPKLKDSTAKILIKKGFFPKNGLSDSVFKSHSGSLSSDFYRYANLSDAQHDHAMKNHDDMVQQNSRLTPNQIKKQLDNGLKVDSGNSYRLLKEKKFFDLPEEKRLPLDISGIHQMKEATDLTPAEYKKAKKTFDLDMYGTMGTESFMHAFAHAHPDLLNDIAGSALRPEQQALLVMHPKLTPEGLERISTDSGLKRSFRFAKPEATTAVSALHHPKMTKEVANKIVDYWKDKNSPLFHQIERTAKRVK